MNPVCGIFWLPASAASLAALLLQLAQNGWLLDPRFAQPGYRPQVQRYTKETQRSSSSSSSMPIDDDGWDAGCGMRNVCFCFCFLPLTRGSSVYNSLARRDLELV